MTGHQQAEESRSQGPARAGKHIQKDGTALGGSGGDSHHQVIPEFGRSQAGAAGRVNLGATDRSFTDVEPKNSEVPTLPCPSRVN